MYPLSSFPQWYSIFHNYSTVSKSGNSHWYNAVNLTIDLVHDSPVFYMHSFVFCEGWRDSQEEGERDREMCGQFYHMSRLAYLPPHWRYVTVSSPQKSSLIYPSVATPTLPPTSFSNPGNHWPVLHKMPPFKLLPLSFWHSGNIPISIDHLCQKGPET